MPGAREAVAALRERGMALRFVTNTTTRPRRRILERLDRLGFDVGAARARHARSARGAAVHRPRPPARRAADERRRQGGLRRPRGGRTTRQTPSSSAISATRFGLRTAQPRVPPPDGRRRADRPAEEPLLADARRAGARRRPVRRRARVRDGARGRRGRQARAGVLRDGARRARRAGRSGRRWSATTWRPTSAARSPPASPGSSSARASTATRPCGERRRADRDGRLDRRSARAVHGSRRNGGYSSRISAAYATTRSTQRLMPTTSRKMSRG